MLKFIRNYPILFGILLAFVGFPIVFFILLYNPSIAPYIGRNKPWFSLGTFTASFFPFLAFRLRPRHDEVAYWGLVAALFVLHVSGLVSFILFVRPIAPIEYGLYGPFEAIALAYLLYRGKLLIRIYAESHRDA